MVYHGICLDVSDALYKKTSSLLMEQMMDSDNVYDCDNFDDNTDLEMHFELKSKRIVVKLLIITYIKYGKDID